MSLISRVGLPRIAKCNFAISAPTSPTIELIARLRKQTHAPLAKCREILIQSNWDFSKAVAGVEEYMQAAGMKRALSNDLALKASMIFAKVTDQKISILELASESDFAANNKHFQQLGIEITGEPDESTISSLISTNSAKLGEKISILESFTYEFASTPMNLAIYAHNPPSPLPVEAFKGTRILVGSKICIIGFEGEVSAFRSNPKLSTQLAQHAMAMNPTRLNDSESKEDSEAVFARQKFLFDENVSIQQLLGEQKAKFVLLKEKFASIRVIRE